MPVLSQNGKVLLYYYGIINDSTIIMVSRPITYRAKYTVLIIVCLPSYSYLSLPILTNFFLFFYPIHTLPLLIPTYTYLSLLPSLFPSLFPHSLHLPSAHTSLHSYNHSRSFISSLPIPLYRSTSLPSLSLQSFLYLLIPPYSSIHLPIPYPSISLPILPYPLSHLYLSLTLSLPLYPYLSLPNPLYTFLCVACVIYDT